MSTKNNGNAKNNKLFIGGICAIAAALLILGGGIFLIFSDKNNGETMTPGGFAAVGEEIQAATALQLIR